MTKTLENTFNPSWKKVKKAVKTTILSLIASVALTGCPQSCIPTPIGLPPELAYSIDKSSVNKGESVRAKASGTAKNGKSIIEHYLGIDEGSDGTIDYTLTQEEPIDVSRELTRVGKTTYYFDCIDSEGLNSGEKKLEAIVSEPTTTTTIPVKPLPTADFSGFERDFKLIDGQQKEYTLPIPRDSNGVEVPYKAVRVVSGNEYLDSIEIDALTRKLTTKPKPINQETSCQLEFDFGTQESGTATYSTNVIPIENLCNISGTIESNWEAEGVTKPGEVRGFAEGDSSKRVFNYNSSSGNFDVQANAPAKSITLEGRFNEKKGINSYVRQLTLDATKDYSNIRVIAEPSPTFCTKKEFYDWMLYTSADFHLEGWDLTKPLNFELVYQHPDKDKGIFAPSNQEIVRQIIIASNAGEAFFNNKLSLDDKIQIDNSSTTDFHYGTIGRLYALPNWIVIVSVDGLNQYGMFPCAGLTSVGYLNNDGNTHTINRAIIMLDSNRLSEEYLRENFIHELNHASLSPIGEGIDPVNLYSVMSVNLLEAGLADIKKAKLTYNRYSLGEPCEKILGLKFLDE